LKTNSAYQRTVARAFLVLGCVCAALLANPRAARAQEAVRAASDVSAFLARVAPTVVKVSCGDGWGTGALFGDSRHVITSFALVNRSGKRRVFLADGKAVSAKVVAWSKQDGLALLELERDAEVRPLPVAKSEPSAGHWVMVLYHPRDQSLDADKPGEVAVPMPAFGRVGRVGNTELDLDANAVAQQGFSGAPVISESGSFIGILARERSYEQDRVIATRVDRAEELYAKRGRQGTFSSEWDSGPFAALFGTLGPEFGVGFGVDSGFRAGWIRAGLTGAFLRAGYRPIRNGRFRSLDRVTLEVQCVGQIDFAKYHRFVLGPALALTLDHIRRREHGDDRTLYETLESKTRLRPSLVLGAIEGPLLTRFVVSPYPEMEGRLDLGISFGR
jgi:hypothetical protein